MDHSSHSVPRSLKTPPLQRCALPPRAAESKWTTSIGGRWARVSKRGGWYETAKGEDILWTLCGKWTRVTTSPDVDSALTRHVCPTTAGPPHSSEHAAQYDHKTPDGAPPRAQLQLFMVRPESHARPSPTQRRSGVTVRMAVGSWGGGVTNNIIDSVPWGRTLAVTLLFVNFVSLLVWSVFPSDFISVFLSHSVVNSLTFN